MKDYFSFSKKEKRAVLTLAVASLFFAFLPVLFPLFMNYEPDIILDDALQQQLAMLEAEEVNTEKKFHGSDEQHQFQHYKKYPASNYPQQNGVLAAFDPNTASEAELKQLGFREKLVQTMINYRNKGGRFRKPEDLANIYGLTKEEYQRFLPYITIQLSEDQKERIYFNKASAIKSSEMPAANKIVININTADTSDWEKLNGIGSKLSRRIVNFRQKLGGFVSVEQVGETFGLPDSTFQKIKKQLVNDPGAVRKININTATIDEMKSHPYIRFAIANAIVQYRNEHGNFQAVADLLNITVIDEELYRKIQPYLTVK